MADFAFKITANKSQAARAAVQKVDEMESGKDHTNKSGAALRAVWRTDRAMEAFRKRLIR